eukprot:2248014-Amphidinium_carterae.1
MPSQSPSQAWVCISDDTTEVDDSCGAKLWMSIEELAGGSMLGGESKFRNCARLPLDLFRVDAVFDLAEHFA